MKLKKDNELLFIVGNAAIWLALGIGLIVSNDKGGIIYILFGVFLLWLELVSEKRYADKIERELNEEQRQQRTIIVRVGKDEEKRTTD